MHLRNHETGPPELDASPVELVSPQTLCLGGEILLR
jgi:hypothetical protein